MPCREGVWRTPESYVIVERASRGRDARTPRCSQAAGVATRPRGVRLSMPIRTRNGSTTDSIVSGLLADRRPRACSSPTGPPSKRRDDRIQHGAVEPVEAERVDVVELERGVHGRRGPGSAAVHERVVAHAAQQPVRDARGAAAAASAISARDAGGMSRSSMRAARASTCVELAVVVELEVAR